MAVKLKLTRMGSKKHPFYRVVAANDETRRDGRPLDFLGYYNPMTSPAEVKFDVEKVAFYENGVPHRFDMTCGQIVINYDVVSPRAQFPDRMTSDISCAACYKYHKISPFALYKFV